METIMVHEKNNEVFKQWLKDNDIPHHISIEGFVTVHMEDVPTKFKDELWIRIQS